MCLGRARICLEWYQGTGIGYHELLLVQEAYKLRRILFIKGAGEAWWWRPCDPSTLEAEACLISTHRTRKKSTQDSFLLWGSFCLFMWRKCVFTSGAAMIICVFFFKFGHYSVLLGSHVCHLSTRFLAHSMSFISFHGQRSCNVFTAFLWMLYSPFHRSDLLIFFFRDNYVLFFFFPGHS